MELRLSGEIVDHLTAKKHKVVMANKGYRRTGEALIVDLSDLELEDVVSLHDIIEKYPKQTGYTKSQAREVRMWLAIKEDPSGTIGKLHRLPSMLREYLKKKKVFRLYKREEELSDIWLPYAVINAKFTPGSRKTGPAYVTITLAHYRFGVVETTSFSVYDRVVSKTVEQVLFDKGYRLETKELHDQWQGDVERYLKLRGDYGFQVLGKGFGFMETGSSYWRALSRKSLSTDGVSSRLVVHKEDKKEEDKPAVHEASFWLSNRSEEDEALKEMNFQKKVDAASRKARNEDDEFDAISRIDPDEDDEEEQEQMLDVPLHAYTTFFDLEKHYEIDAHVRSVEDYVYDKTLGEKLVLPDDVKDLVEMLLDETAGNFKDIVVGKNAGTIVMLRGPPGTGKTLCAEVYAEVMERPLYKIQSSQLGTSPETLETELKEVLARADLWKALLLIDECDVFVHARGEDLVQNAVVGVILRVLEYFQGVLFLTTNREAIVDDAIMSRCTASIRIDYPTQDQQELIWEILAKNAGVPIKKTTIEQISGKYATLAGRDVKNILKLGHLVMKRRGFKELTLETVDFVVRFLHTPALSDQTEEEELEDFATKGRV